VLGRGAVAVLKLVDAVMTQPHLDVLVGLVRAGVLQNQIAISRQRQNRRLDPASTWVTGAPAGVFSRFQSSALSLLRLPLMIAPAPRTMCVLAADPFDSLEVATEHARNSRFAYVCFGR
jgi:hypothetical protein